MSWSTCFVLKTTGYIWYTLDCMGICIAVHRSFSKMEKWKPSDILSYNGIGQHIKIGGASSSFKVESLRRKGMQCLFVSEAEFLDLSIVKVLLKFEHTVQVTRKKATRQEKPVEKEKRNKQKSPAIHASVLRHCLGQKRKKKNPVVE